MIIVTSSGNGIASSSIAVRRGDNFNWKYGFRSHSSNRTGTSTFNSMLAAEALFSRSILFLCCNLGTSDLLGSLAGTAHGVGGGNERGKKQKQNQQ
jgi:hypothetical protein